MSLSTDPLDELSIPDGTTVEEHDLVTDGDVLMGGRSTVEFGIRGRNVLAGEGVRIGGGVEAEADCRLDMWSDVAGNVLVGRDAFIGERTHIGGQLMVSGDLDVGDDVDIEDGFEANGWIVIRNPMPTIVFLFVYLKQLMLLGEEEAAQNLVNELADEEDPEEAPLIVPRGATVSDDAWRVSTPASIGDECRLHGNIRAESIAVGEDCNIFGSLRAKHDIYIGEGTRVHGDVTTRKGEVRIAPGALVLGDVSCSDLELSKGAEVDGTMRARGNITMQGIARRDVE
ncbi:polymer-forming cytoskeletal protein [Haloarchaeobius baliensis]|uniref:polymer-forming cytoskeletal protein n=1 Tax=Haloarchaeobius baliensis TaxID=1670458 RepID=UPI003F88551A